MLLDNIEVDSNLPKHRTEKSDVDSDNVEFQSSTSGRRIPNPPTILDYGAHLQYLKYVYSMTPSFKLKLKIWFYKKFYCKIFGESTKNEMKEIIFIRLQDFFNSVKNSVNQIDEDGVTEVLSKYFDVIENAEHNNQVALVERIKDYVTTLNYELILSKSKFNKFISEADVVDFYNVASTNDKYKTGLCLTYVKNFVKIIPKEVTDLKKEADTLKVFDNYAVLHYDFEGNSVEDTKKEKEAKKKDPILFGIIANSRKLYYIGDWVDDYCDLTLDVIIKKLGKTGPSEINAETLKSDIDKI